MSWLDRIVESAVSRSLWTPRGVSGRDRRIEIEQRVGWKLPSQIAEFADRFGNADLGSLEVIVNGDPIWVNYDLRSADDWCGCIHNSLLLLDETPFNDLRTLVISPCPDCYVIHAGDPAIYHYISYEGGWIKGQHVSKWNDLEALLAYWVSR
jgi:hypothetical protein